MSELIVSAAATPDADGAILRVSPESAGWGHVGFEVLALDEGQAAERDTGDRELCLVVVAGRCHVRSAHGDWTDLGGRADPFSGLPDAAYLPPRTRLSVEGGAGGPARVRGGAVTGRVVCPAARPGADGALLPTEAR